MPQQFIPLIGTQNQRLGSNLTALLSGAPAATTPDQFFVDAQWQVYTNDLSKTTTTYTRGRETYTVTVNPGSGITYSVLGWSGKGAAYAAISQGSALYIFDGNSVTAGPLGIGAGHGVHLSETSISGTPNIVVITDNGNGDTYFYPDGGASTQITSGSYPPNLSSPEKVTGNAAHLNGRMRVMSTAGNIFESDINSLSGWTTGAYLNASEVPDPGVGVARWKDLILGFGKISTEPFEDAGNPSGSQLNRIRNGTINVGCVNEHSYCEFNDTIAWIGLTGTSGLGVYIYQGPGQTPKKISTDAVDAYLANVSEIAGGFSFTTRLNRVMSAGKQLLILSQDVSKSRALAYDPEINEWGIFNFSEVGSALYKSTPYGVKSLVGFGTGGAWAITSESYRSPIYQTSNITFGNGNRKIIKSVALDCDLSSGNATLTVTKDDSFGASSVVSSTGTFNLASPMPRLYRHGIGRQFAFRLAMPNGTCRVRGLLVDYDTAAT